MSRIICPHCASEIPEGFQFCGNCGRKLDPVVQQEQALPKRHAFFAPLVGRDDELHRLVERWATSRGGERGIEIRGQGGIGKTRLVQEAAKRIEGKRLLTVVARPGTNHRPFGMARGLVHAVVGEVLGQAAPPETRDAFAAALALLGHNLSSFVDVLWCLAAPHRLAAPVLGSRPQMLRWSLERALEVLLTRLAEYAPDMTLFFDANELADEASLSLFTSLHERPRGGPLPIIVSSRLERQNAWRPDVEIALGPLTDDAAAELLDRLLRGAQLPEVLRQDVLRRAAGVPRHLEDTVWMLVDQGVLAQAGEGSGWSYTADTPSVHLPASNGQAIVDRLEQPTRALLGQCAIQGIEFDADVTDAVQRLMHRPGPPPRVLLPKLERQDLVESLAGDPWPQWAFAHPLLQEACYGMLPPPERRALHAETAEALCALMGGPETVPLELLAYHYERAEQWLKAAAANLRAGDWASEACLNESALRLYERVGAMLARLDTPSDEAVRLAVLAHAGAANVHLRTGTYILADEEVKKMQAMTIGPGDRGEADRLTALVHVHMGRMEEAERFLLHAVSSARDDASHGVLAHTLCDLAKLYSSMGHRDAALERLRECRTLAASGDGLAQVRADVVEGDIAAEEGRLTEAIALYARAHQAADHAGSMPELASASNGLGIAARDVGDYETAQCHFEHALEIWKVTGNAECIAGAYMNLGLLAMSRGDLEAAQAHYERALATFRAMGNLGWSALAKANLAILALEEGDVPGAVTAAEASLAMLSDAHQAVVRGQVLVVLGEGRLKCGDALGARRAFDSVLQDYDEAQSPLTVAQAWRGLGRVALMTGAPDEAMGLLDRALAGFERLQRAQEAARTAFYRAVTLIQLGQTQRARTELERTREQFVSMRMRADRDALQAERLLHELYAVSRPG